MEPRRDWFCADLFPGVAFLIADRTGRVLDDSVFSADERAFSRTFASASRREEWLWGRAVLKDLLFRRFGLSSSETTIVSENGRPALRAFPSRAVSLAHKGRFIAAAVSEKDGRLGVDIETRDSVRDSPRAIERACSESELRVARGQKRIAYPSYLGLLWCLKEASVKAGGAASVFSARVPVLHPVSFVPLSGWNCFAPSASFCGMRWARAFRTREFFAALVAG